VQLSEFNDATFVDMVDSFIDEYLQMYPSRATYIGIHKFDHLLENVSQAAIDDFIEKEKEYLHLCESFEAEGSLNKESQIDLEILTGILRADPVYHQVFKRYFRDPSLYINLITSSCHILWLRDFADKEQRYAALVSRLKAIPELLSEAKENLRKADFIPEIWLEVARDMADSAGIFFSGTIGAISGEVPSLKNELLAASDLTIKVVKDYRRFLDDELSAKPDGSFAAGRKLYELLLKEIHMLPYTSNELEQIGLDYIDKTTNRLNELNNEVNPGKSWPEVIEEIKNDYPAAEELLDYYKKEVAATRRFIMEREIVSVPDNEMLELMETPAFMRALLPYAAYMMPAPFEADQTGFFWVTPVDRSASDDKKREQLSGHSRSAITVRSLHEGYPGHHLQLCHANLIKSKIRRIFRTSVFAEGWALYCEDLMRETGFYRDKRIELMQLKDQLWRSCRVVLDVRLHAGECTFDEAVTMLVNTARLENSNARAEVRRYTQTPTQPMSYLMGKIEIEKLLRDIRFQSPDMPIRDIHNRLLSYGTIPVTLVRQAMLGTN